MGVNNPEIPADLQKKGGSTRDGKVSPLMPRPFSSEENAILSGHSGISPFPETAISTSQR